MTEYGEGRKWALGKFGKDALRLRRDVPASMHKVHLAYLEAHMSIVRAKVVDRPSARGYGSMWGELFEVLVQNIPGRVEGARPFKPKGSPYRVLMVGNTLVYPLRCTQRIADGFLLGQLSTQREGLLSGRIRDEPGLFPAPAANAEPDDLTDEEAEIVQAFHEAGEEQGADVVAAVMNSSIHGLRSLEWGDVVLREGGLLCFKDFHENLGWAITPAADAGTQVAGQVNGGPIGSLGRPSPAVIDGGFASGDPIAPPMQPRGPGQNKPPASGTDVNETDEQKKEKQGEADS